MPPTKSVDCVPVLLTHWDPDMYSSDALPLIPELVIQILVHGEVWLKEVDLFLNESIREQLGREEQFEQFSSLVELTLCAGRKMSMSRRTLGTAHKTAS